MLLEDAQRILAKHTRQPLRMVIDNVGVRVTVRVKAELRTISVVQNSMVIMCSYEHVLYSKT